MSNAQTPSSTKRAPVLIVAFGALAIAASAAFWLHRATADRPPTSAQVLKVGNQPGAAHAVMQAAGVLKDTPYRIEWSLFPAASPLLEALGAQAIDIGGVGDAPFAFAYAGGAHIKAAQAYRYNNAGRASAILVRADSPIRSPGWGLGRSGPST